MHVFANITVRPSAEWTVLEIMDMHGEELRIAHWHPNPKLSIHLPANRKGFHCRDLSRSQCLSLGSKLLRFGRTGLLEDANAKDDYQI